MDNRTEEKIQFIADFAGYGFLAVAKKLRELEDETPEHFAVVTELLAIDRLDANFMVRVDRICRELDIDENYMAALGWAKLVVLCDYICLGNRRELLEIADKTTAKELAEILRRQRVGTKPIALFLSDEQYSVLEKAILTHGGVRSKRSPDRLSGKEEALVKALSSKSD